MKEENKTLPLKQYLHLHPVNHGHVYRDYQSTRRTQGVSPPTSPPEPDSTRTTTRTRRGRRSGTRSGLTLSLNLLWITPSCSLKLSTVLSDRLVGFLVKPPDFLFVKKAIVRYKAITENYQNIYC